MRITSGRTGRLLLRVDGEAGGDRFGGSLAAIDDLDGDGVADFVSNPDPPHPARPSHIALISSRTGKTIAKITPDADEVDLGLFAVTSGGGDLDGDGSPDLAVVTSRSPGRTGMVELRIYSSGAPGLLAAPHRLPMRQPGVQLLDLDAGRRRAGLRYWMLGSFTGTDRGFQLGAARVPLNYDDYTTWTILNPSSALMPRATGLLDSTGRARVSFAVPGGGPVLSPFTVHHAFVVFDPQGRVVYASNPCWLRLE